MKKSNIIIIAMLIVALGGILSIFISQKHQDNIEYAIKEIMLTDYNVIVVQAGSNCNIQNSDSNKIVLRYEKKHKLKSISFRQSKDTLYLTAKSAFDCGYIIHGKTITKIIAQKESQLGLIGLTRDSLSIESDNAYINIGDIANRVFINAVNSSKLDVWGESQNQLTVSLSESRLYFNSKKTTCLKALLNRGSELNVNGNPEMSEIKCDSTSSYSCYNR